MKVLIICAFIAVASAGVAHHGVGIGILNTGASTNHRSEDGLGNYGFGYNEAHSTGSTFRKEHGDGLGNKVGSYGLVDADGRQRVVSYVADGLGFRANVQTNEPGTEPRDPAAVLINKAGTPAVPLGYAGDYYGGYGKGLGYAGAIGLGHAGIGLGYGGAIGGLGYGGAIGGLGYGVAGLGHAYTSSIGHGVGVGLGYGGIGLAGKGIGLGYGGIGLGKY